MPVERMVRPARSVSYTHLGYARFDGETLALTPAGMIVQNTILAELL